MRTTLQRQSSEPYNGLGDELFEKNLMKHFFNNTWKTCWSYHDHVMNYRKLGYLAIMPGIMAVMPRNMASKPSSCHDHGVAAIFFSPAEIFFDDSFVFSLIFPTQISKFSWYPRLSLDHPPFSQLMFCVMNVLWLPFAFSLLSGKAKLSW